MALIDFAPLRIPLHRRLETAAVALYYYSFFFGALLGFLIIIGLLYTWLYPIALFYLAWAYLFDSGTPSHGGRRSKFMRKLKVWEYFRDYFPISLIKTAELDPQKNYVFGYHPHGILCAGAFCNFATEATNFTEVFSGITPHLLPLMGEDYSCINTYVIYQLGRSVLRKTLPEVLNVGNKAVCQGPFSRPRAEFFSIRTDQIIIIIIIYFLKRI
jgi:hypothetical protein